MRVLAVFDEIGGGAATLAKLEMFAVGAKTLTLGVGLFTAGVGALAFLPKLGFPLVLC